MARVTIDRYKALPEICVVTGSERDVSFERVKLSQGQGESVAASIALSLFLAPFGMYATPRAKEKVELSLPFSRDAWDAFERGRQLVTISVVGWVVAIVAGFALAGFTKAPPFAGVGLGTWWIPLAVWVWSRSLGPRVVGLADGRQVVLDLPSAEAARAFPAFQAKQHERARERAAKKKRAQATAPVAKAKTAAPAKVAKPLSVARRGPRRPSL